MERNGMDLSTKDRAVSQRSVETAERQPSTGGSTASTRSIPANGGRRPSHRDSISGIGRRRSFLSELDPGPRPSEARLTVIQVTDVYTLAYFGSLRTMIQDIKAKSEGAKVISVLTGDFLAPYLLSTVDHGAGMMNALAKTPIDYLTWGNHEADVDHRIVCRHVENFPGTWLNSNMQDHDAMAHQKPFDVVEVVSPDGSHARRVGLVAVLDGDPALYSHFEAPGAFGGARIGDPWECLAEYKALLEGPEHNCDLVIPLQHLYVPDDHRTCREFDFPVILGGHDHHRVDETVEGTRLLKPGLDAVYATVLELCWRSPDAGARPDVSARFVRVGDWKPDPVLHEENLRAYDALLPLRNTELAQVPSFFRPLSSENARGRLTTMGQFVCSLIKSSINTKRGGRQRNTSVDAVILMGGNIRGGTSYPPDSFFSLEALEAEIKTDEVVAVVRVPGRVLSDGIRDTHAGDPKPGWMQYDNGIRQDLPGGPVTRVAGEPIRMEKMYRVATKISDLTNGQSRPFTEYFTAHPELFPPKGAYLNIHAELMALFARNVWRRVWEGVGPSLRASFSGSLPKDDVKYRLDKLDLNHDGVVSMDEIHAALTSVAGLSVDDSEKSLARFVHSFADLTGNGKVTLEDLEMFCQEMPSLYESENWHLAFRKANDYDDGNGDHASIQLQETVHSS